MAIEIEAKIKVEQLGNYARRLEEFHAEYQGKSYQKDVFFDRDYDSLIDSDCGLRLRTQTKGGSTEHILCYKGPRAKTAAFKEREEIELTIGDPTKIQQIFAVLGFNITVTVEKNRDLWLLDGCEVCLDDVIDLGCFIEIEGPNPELIGQIVQKLNLAKSEHINISYAKMLHDLLRKP